MEDYTFEVGDFEVGDYVRIDPSLDLDRPDDVGTVVEVWNELKVLWSQAGCGCDARQEHAGDLILISRDIYTAFIAGFDAGAQEEFDAGSKSTFNFIRNALVAGADPEKLPEDFDHLTPWAYDAMMPDKGWPEDNEQA